jgi:putative endonuclease
MTANQGAWAEERALAYLQAHGLALLARNYRCRGGELDLVMEGSGMLVFVEVRHRASADFGTPEETVTASKQKRLLLAARTYLLCHPRHAARPMRFDVVSLQGKLSEARIKWIRNAFGADG